MALQYIQFLFAGLGLYGCPVNKGANGVTWAVQVLFQSVGGERAPSLDKRQMQ